MNPHFSFSLSVSVTLSLSLSAFLCLCYYLSLSLSMSLSLLLSLTLTVSVYVSVSVTLSHSHCLYVSLYVSVSMSLSLSLCLCLCLYVSISQAPVFLLFLDCVWQLWSQFPSRFQLTDHFLLALYDSTHLPLFSSFLANCQRERCKRTQVRHPVQVKSKRSWYNHVQYNRVRVRTCGVPCCLLPCGNRLCIADSFQQTLNVFNLCTV